MSDKAYCDRRCISMEGTYANLPAICELAEEYNALVMVDDAHATGFVGPTGRGTHEYNNVMGRVDIITGTLGKALGGACGGFISSSEGIIDLLRKGHAPIHFQLAASCDLCRNDLCFGPAYEFCGFGGQTA